MKENGVQTSVILTPELKAQLEEWARDEDRTISATLRRILVQEALRRKQRREVKISG